MSSYDLLILTDATASMGSYLKALHNSLPEIIRISALTGCFSRIGVVAYRDYNGGTITEWSGWYGADGETTTSKEQLLGFVKSLRPEYGGDWPEATKTGLACAYENMRADCKTVMLLYTDAPPHTPATGGTNREKERKRLQEADAFGGCGPLFVDWVSAANALRQGEKTAQVFGIVQSRLADTLAPYLFLAARTGGVCLEIAEGSPADLISKVTLGVLLAWMGVEKEGSKASLRPLAKVLQYNEDADVDKVTSEEDELSKPFWVMEDKEPIVNLVKQNLGKTDVGVDDMRRFVSGRNPAMTNFSKRYLADEAYRELVVKHLADIIESDVAAVAVNPVFGSLWRTVCNDRLNEARDGLIQAFGTQVEKISDAGKKAQMKEWLEESYDYAAEILEITQSVPDDESYPCVFLDPTLEFNPTPTEAEEDEDAAVKDQAKFTREELLEIGRSCDYRILRRLGRVLTRLTYVETKDDLPAHIKAEAEDKVPRIPLALVAPKYKRKFWKILLHTVLPGTMLTPRPAALLAALSLRMGMLPLREAADAELLHWNKWNTLDIPETWNSNCLALVLEADSNYEARVREGTTVRPNPEARLLTDEDRRLFKALVDYKMMEMNLKTTLTAKVGWHPAKSKVAIGPTTACRTCHYPRSVTVMAPGGTCGLCDETTCDCESPEHHEAFISSNVAQTDGQNTKITWVECGVTNCRAQYVVYNHAKLNLRPKCHFCRISGRAATDTTTPPTAPFVECARCLSRIIWPVEYRSAGFDASDFSCPACMSGDIQTIIDTLATANQLTHESGRSWLLRNEDAKIADPFNGRSLFHVISTAGPEAFADKVEVLPLTSESPVFTLKGKLVRNSADVVDELRTWISSRRAQADTCSLCFSSFKKRDLRAACGRAGCHQRICGGCHKDWYGLNGRGKLINVAALSCPFCRRQPAPGTVSTFGLNVLGNLRLAVEEAGSWIYAWCNDCGLARRFVERVCASGAPPEIQDWRCEDCREKDGQVLVRTKKCPGCGTPTEKMGGCDHMECTVEGCGTHWCFNCGEGVPLEQIYDHMSAAHGGWYDGYDSELEDDFVD